MRLTDPIEEDILCAFVAHLALRTREKPAGLAYSTIKSYLSGVRSACIELGMQRPMPPAELPRLQRMLRGLKKEQRGPATRARLPVTLELLALAKPMLDLERVHDHRVWWAMAVAGVRGLMRLGELTHEKPTGAAYRERLLRDRDVCEFRSTSCAGVELKLRMSKTDLFHESVTVPLMETRDQLCAATAIRTLLSQSPFERAADTALFTLANGEVLTRPRFVEVLQRLVSAVARRHALKVDASRYTGHSLRRGGATSLASLGVPDHLIQLLGRWRSDCYKLYITTPRETIASVFHTTAMAINSMSAEALASRVAASVRDDTLHERWWAQASTEC